MKPEFAFSGEPEVEQGFRKSDTLSETRDRRATQHEELWRQHREL